MSDLSRAKELYRNGAYTCVLVKGDRVYTSEKCGILPLVELIDSAESFNGFSAADKIVGKAAAMLYSYLGVSNVYAEVMSGAGAEVLSANGIAYECDALTDKIINRAGTDICPMEKAVEFAKDNEHALMFIKEKLNRL